MVASWLLAGVALGVVLIICGVILLGTYLVQLRDKYKVALQDARFSSNLDDSTKRRFAQISLAKQAADALEALTPQAFAQYVQAGSTKTVTQQKLETAQLAVDDLLATLELRPVAAAKPAASPLEDLLEEAGFE
jgi:hypothetical protein